MRLSDSTRFLQRHNALKTTLLAASLMVCCTCRTTQPQGLGAKGQAQSQTPAHLREGPLPEGVTPRLYDIGLTLDPNSDTFDGRATVAIDVLEPHKHILMHAKNLSFSHVSAQSSDGRTHQVHIEQGADSELMRLSISPPLPSGMASLTFLYQGQFSSDLFGLYRSQSAGENYIFSQLELMAARRVFPSFDEPRFKTPFEVTLTVPENLTAISNSSVLAEQRESIEHDGNAVAKGYKRLIFEPTPPLPTYLLAMAVGPFDSVSQQLPVSLQRPYNVGLRGFATKGQGQKLEAALNHVAPLLLALESRNNLPYPFGKLDFIAVPDFAFSGMENAGAITLKDWLMLWDPLRPSYEQRRTFEMVAAHELTHQWFGDWVTMAWWDDLWLNEAFATWQGLKVAHETRPHMQLDVEQIEGMLDAMRHDALMSARRVRQPCVTQDDIYNAGDIITYRKGAGILEMFEHYIGVDAMQAGIQAYLRQFPFRTADAGNFLSALATSSRRAELPEAVNTFLQQPGVPDVAVSWQCHGNDQATLTLSQSRYVPRGSQITSDTQWQVPVCVRFGTARGEQEVCHLLRSNEATLPLRGCPVWVSPNAQGKGYYRWHVPEERWSEVFLATTQKHTSSGEVFALIDNLWAASQAGHLSAPKLLHFLQQSTYHPSTRVARRALGYISEAYFRYVDPKEREAAQRHLRNLTSPIYQQATQRVRALEKRYSQLPHHSSAALNTGDDLGEAKLLRRDAALFLVEVIQDAKLRGDLAHAGVARLDRIAKRVGTTQGVLAPLVVDTKEFDEGVAADSLALAGDTLGEAFVKRMVDALATEDRVNERHVLIGGLKQLRAPQAAAAVRNALMSQHFKAAEILEILSGHMHDPALRGETWSFVTQQLTPLRHRLGDVSAARLIGLSDKLCRTEDAMQIEALFAPVLSEMRGSPRLLAQAKETIALCAADRELAREAALTFFTGQKAPKQTQATQEAEDTF